MATSESRNPSTLASTREILVAKGARSYGTECSTRAHDESARRLSEITRTHAVMVVVQNESRRTSSGRRSEREPGVDDVVDFDAVTVDLDDRVRQPLGIRVTVVGCRRDFRPFTRPLAANRLRGMATGMTYDG